MPTIAEVRAQYPQYSDMPDAALADALYKKFYSDMPRAQFDAKVGMAQAPKQQQQDIVPHKGFGAQINNAFTVGPNKGAPARPWSELGQNYADIAQGAVEGVPAGIGGALGDIEATGRLLMSPLGVSRENFMPTSSSMGDKMWGPAKNEYQAGGRMGGNMLSPLVVSKLLGAAGGGLSKLVAGGGPTPQAMDASAVGYKLPPNMASAEPGIVSSMLSGVGGKHRLEQAASVKNQPITNSLAARELGLPADEDVTLSALEGVRQKAGKAYEAVKSLPIDILPDKPYQQDLSKIGQMSEAARNEFGDLVSNPEVDKIVSVLAGKEKMSPDAAVELAKSLRYKAGVNLKNYASPEKLELGHAQSQAANAIESLLERNMQAATTAMRPLGGQDMNALMQNLRAARQMIAKSYDIQKALNLSTGNIDARVLGSALDAGRPLSGNLETIANAANSFKQAMRPPEAFGGAQTHTALDFLAGLASHGKTAGLSLARPAARGLVLSGPYQRALSAGSSPQAAQDLMRMLADPKVRALLAAQTTARTATAEPAYAAP